MERLPTVGEGLDVGKVRTSFTVIFPAAVAPPVEDDVKF